MGQSLKIYFAGGCFWGVEAYFARIPGVLDVVSGYANGRTENPSYEDLIYRQSGHAETVEVTYDPMRVSLDELLRHLFRIIDPTSLNRQGNDIGTQYRTGIYYVDETGLSVIQSRINAEQKKHAQKIAVEVKPLEQFFKAEDYHQDYLDKNPTGYCHVDLSLAAQPLDPPYTKPDDATLRETLSPEAYRITQENGTERPFTSPFWNTINEGIYVDTASGEPLFSSRDQFVSSCGWPSFAKPITDDAVEYLEDTSYGMERVEVRSRYGDSHLGHVFPDGPGDLGGNRYCINGVALRFIPKETLVEAGYADWAALFEAEDGNGDAE